MGHAKRDKLVFTVKDKCKMCYTCVRECPAKAIRIINGQAEVLNERCIGCGNCVSVCSQNAKVYLNSIDQVEHLLANGDKVVAIMAPSFPAEFLEIEDHKTLIGMIRKLGFYKVNDVAFGADMVAHKYQIIMEEAGDKSFISSDCPAIVFYIEQFHPELIDNIAPVCSPMVAIARICRHIYGKDAKIVFVGPCVAKKAESDEIDEAITFAELRQLFAKSGITPENVEKSEFDPPFSAKGAIFPISRGLLQTVNKTDDILDGKIIVASGKNNFKEAIKEFEHGEISNTHLELLCCNGCIMGPGMTERNKHFLKRSQISNYVKAKLHDLNIPRWEANMKLYASLDYSQNFRNMDRRTEMPRQNDIKDVLKRMGKEKPEDFLNCGACGYDTCMDHAIAVLEGYAESEMCLPYTIEKLHHSITDLNVTNENLANAKLALKQSEKLAHMGQLSAGIAHELNNPLGVITMYTNLMMEDLKKDDPMVKDLELVVEQANRCKNIVGGLLNFARKNRIKPTEVNLVDFATHSLESVVMPDNIKTNVVASDKLISVMIDPDQMMQAITNIEKNAIEAMPNGGTLTVELSKNKFGVGISISDTGTGISEENMDKLFTPFFTTKETGKGTGLGLPLVYGIIKMHNGKIDVKSNTDPNKGSTGTTFIINIPYTL